MATARARSAARAPGRAIASSFFLGRIGAVEHQGIGRPVLGEEIGPWLSQALGGGPKTAATRGAPRRGGWCPGPIAGFRDGLLLGQEVRSEPPRTVDFVLATEGLLALEAPVVHLLAYHRPARVNEAVVALPIGPTPGEGIFDSCQIYVSAFQIRADRPGLGLGSSLFAE